MKVNVTTRIARSCADTDSEDSSVLVSGVLLFTLNLSVCFFLFYSKYIHLDNFSTIIIILVGFLALRDANRETISILKW